MIYAPDYYPQFHCIASACRHSCCVGWEIDIDADTRAAYAAVGGAFGRRLAKAIEDGEGGAHFRLGKDERCPMLRRDGLCDLILTLGEDALCQICSDHPRFRNFFTGRTEIGLGLCCEAAAALILTRPTPMQLIEIEDDGDNARLTDAESGLLQLRRELIGIAGMGDIVPSIDERIKQMLSHIGERMINLTWPYWVKLCLSLERFDPAWDAMLEATLHRHYPCMPEWNPRFARLLEYFLYRHLPGALEDGRLRERILFAAMSVITVRMVLETERPTLPRMIEAARMYSCEIEYSEDNIDALLTALEAYAYQ